MTDKELMQYKIKINRITGTQCIVQNNGYFFIYNVSESDKDRIIRTLRMLSFTSDVTCSSGKYDFNHFSFNKGYAEPKKLYNISGKIIESITEAIEAHDTLNIKLWNEDKTLKKEVAEKLLEIKDKYIENINSNEIKIEVVDVLLLGSNCNYNYTSDSDIDLHIIVKSGIYSDDELAYKCYLAYCSLFNNKYDPTIYEIPVEIYVENEKAQTAASNGIYSVLNSTWIKEPRKEDINFDNIDWQSEYLDWEVKADAMLNNLKAKSEDVDALINEIYKMRKSAISLKGEYSVGNFIFKELRNQGLLDKLKQMKADLETKEMSLAETLKD